MVIPCRRVHTLLAHSALLPFLPVPRPQPIPFTGLISPLTNSYGCGNILVKVLLNVSPFPPSFPPQPRVYPRASTCSALDHVLSPTNLIGPHPIAAVTLSPSISCRLLKSLASLFAIPVLCFQQLAASFHKIPGVGVPHSRLLLLCESSVLQTLFYLPFVFNNLTNPFFRKSRVSTSIQNPRGVTRPAFPSFRRSAL